MANQSDQLIQLINEYLQQQLADKNYINEKEVLRHVVTKILFIFDLITMVQDGPFEGLSYYL